MIRNVVLAIVLAIQLGLLFVVDPPWEDDPPATEGLAAAKLEAIPLADVVRLEIRDPRGGTATLVQGQEGWLIEEAFRFPATTEKVAAVLAELESLPRATLRSSKPVMFTTFGVDAAQATRLTLRGEGAQALATINVGKRDIQGRQGTFIRLDGDDRTWVIPSQNLAKLIPSNPRAWYGANMMDVDVADQARMTDLREACFEVRIEANAPAADDPSRIVSSRFVFARRDAEGEGPATWSVLEPTEKSALVLDDLLVKNLVSQFLSVRAYRLVGAAAKPEHGLDVPEDHRLRVIARFRENGTETSRTLEIGAKLPPAPGAPAGRGEFLAARAQHPASRATGGFVFGVPETFLRYFEQPPERYQKREIEGR